jgi:hypothetical protein
MSGFLIARQLIAEDTACCCRCGERIERADLANQSAISKSEARRAGVLNHLQAAHDDQAFVVESFGLL